MLCKICGTSLFLSSSLHQGKPTYEMDIEAYTEGNMGSSDYRSEIWVPVIKKGIASCDVFSSVRILFPLALGNTVIGYIKKLFG